PVSPRGVTMITAFGSVIAGVIELEFDVVLGMLDAATTWTNAVPPSPDPIALVLNATPFGTLAPSIIMMPFIPPSENPSKVVVHRLLPLYETATLWLRESPYPG